MRRILLSEYKPSEPVDLSREELASLQRFGSKVRVEPSPMAGDCYILTPGSHVGVVRFGGTTVEIRPKLPIDRFFFILSYAVDPSLWQRDVVDFSPDDSVLEAVAPAFCQLVARATYRGLLHGYQTQEEALPLVRGQIRFGEQIQRRYGLALPVELRFDEFTEDIAENRILLAALHRLSRLPLRSALVRRGLHEISAALHAVSLQRFGPHDIPAVSFSRLNRHYEPAINLATLILKWTSLELGGDSAAGTSFLLDMNEVFEIFVHRALREALHLTAAEFPRGVGGFRLDDAGHIKMKPDLSWWHGGTCRFVGDVKYKDVTGDRVKHHDLYQLLAYTTSADLPAGLLIYAAGEGIVESLDLAAPPPQILHQIALLASEVKSLAAVGAVV